MRLSNTAFYSTSPRAPTGHPNHHSGHHHHQHPNRPPRPHSSVPPRISDSNRKVNPNWSPSEYCLDLVRTRDFESFICLSHLPRETRHAVAALRAFNIETATIKDITRSEEIRRMRLLWWRETIDGLYRGAVIEYPVAIALKDAIERYKLTKGWFVRLLDTRDADLLDRPFRSVQDLEQYSEGTNGSLLYLALEACGVRRVQADHAASHIGKALGLLTAIRATPYLASHRRTSLPLSLLVKHNVSQEDLYRLAKAKNSTPEPAPESQQQSQNDSQSPDEGGTIKHISEVVFDLAGTANVHLEHARALRREVPKAALPALLHAVVCDRLLKRLQYLRFDVYSPELAKRDLWLHLSIWSHYIRGRY